MSICNKIIDRPAEEAHAGSRNQRARGQVFAEGRTKEDEKEIQAVRLIAESERGANVLGSHASLDQKHTHIHPVSYTHLRAHETLMNL
eukprot:6770661-Prymnesium_polylepis.1